MVSQKNIQIGFFFGITLLFPLGMLQGKSHQNVEFPSMDGLTITAELYFDQKVDKPFLLLFHQAAFSLGEYKPTIPLFLKRGFNIMAIDQRSGQTCNSVMNKTAQRAVKKNLKTHYLAAEQDMKAAVDYVYKKLKVKNVILLGSSYSAALVLKIAGEKKYDYTGVISFSPGEYFGKKKYIARYARKIVAPVWVTSSKQEIPRVDKLFKVLKATLKKTFFKPKVRGEHGSKALWVNHSGYKEYRKSLFHFLRQLKRNVSCGTSKMGKN